MTTYSDAAKKYASQAFARDVFMSVGVIDALKEGYDAGYDAAAAVPAEPERLTDPDDPRIQPRARVRLTIDYDVVDEPGAAYQYQESWLRERIGRPTVATTPDHERWYLLAEAPDPDADTVAAISRVLDGELDDWEPDDVRKMLSLLRGIGYDVTKRADA